MEQLVIPEGTFNEVDRCRNLVCTDILCNRLAKRAFGFENIDMGVDCRYCTKRVQNAKSTFHSVATLDV